jgi:hypothetical protein
MKNKLSAQGRWTPATFPSESWERKDMWACSAARRGVGSMVWSGEGGDVREDGSIAACEW